MHYENHVCRRRASLLPQPQQQITLISFQQKYFFSWATATAQFGFRTLFHIFFLLESMEKHGGSGCLTSASVQRHRPSPWQTVWPEPLNII